MKFDDVRKLFELKKVVDLMKKCNVDSVSAFGPDISGHSFNPSASINLILEGTNMGLLEFSEFKKKLPMIIKSFDVLIHTQETLKRLAKQNYITNEYYNQVMAHAKHVAYSEAEKNTGSISISTDNIVAVEDFSQELLNFDENLSVEKKKMRP